MLIAIRKNWHDLYEGQLSNEKKNILNDTSKKETILEEDSFISSS